MTENSSSNGPQDDIDALLGTGGSGTGGLLRRRNWLIFLALVLLSGALAYVFLGTGGSSNNVRYRTDPATRGDITVVVTATGTVEPTNKVEISSELSGIIRSVAVDYNSRIKVGQVLAELDTDKLKATVASSRAKLNATRARVTEAEATMAEKQLELERKQSLANDRIISIQELDTTRAAYARAIASVASAKADVDSAEADLRLQETNLRKACICSPIDGVVLSRNVDPGQVVAASLQAPVLFTIAEDLSKMEIQVDVDEADVGKVQEGQNATFTVDAYPERHFKARIRELHFGSAVVQGVVTYKAVLTTDNAELLLRPGMTATAEIVVDEVKDTLTVSNEALRFTPPTADTESDNRSFLRKLLPGRPPFRPASRHVAAGPERELWVPREGTATAVKVTVGASDGKRTAIVDGAVEAGQEIIVDTLTSKN